MWNIDPTPWSPDVIEKAGSLFSHVTIPFKYDYRNRNNALAVGLAEFTNGEPLTRLGLYAYFRQSGDFFYGLGDFEFQLGEIAFLAARNPERVISFPEYYSNAAELVALLRPICEPYACLAWACLLYGEVEKDEYPAFAKLPFDAAIQYFQLGIREPAVIGALISDDIDPQIVVAMIDTLVSK